MVFVKTAQKPGYDLHKDYSTEQVSERKTGIGKRLRF